MLGLALLDALVPLPVFVLYLLPYGSPVSDKGCNQSINQYTLGHDCTLGHDYTPGQDYTLGHYYTLGHDYTLGHYYTLVRPHPQCHGGVERPLCQYVVHIAGGA